jgi:hypothetical protein
MFLDVKDGSNSTDIVSTSNVSQMSGLVLNPRNNLVLFQIVLDRISLIDLRMSKSDGPGIVGDDVWDLVGSDSLGLDFKQFKFGLSILDLQQSESTLDVVK